MAVNEFLTFAGDPAANVMTQSDYSATGFTSRLLGFSTGTALSIQLNKVWRQASLISNMIGQFTVDNTGLDMVDDGTPAGVNTLETHFTAAITTVARSAVGVGYLPLVGGTLTGPLVIHSAATQLSIQATLAQPAFISMTRDAAQLCSIQANSALTPRWHLILADATRETGNNSGSDFAIYRFADNGTLLGTPLSINRASGVVNFALMPTIAGGSFPFLPLAGGTVSGPLNISAPGVGISYPQGTRHYFAFTWDGNIGCWVDNTYVGAIAMQGWVSNLVGNYLPITGGTLTGALTINSSLVVAGGSGFRSSVWFANLTDFVNFYDGRYRFRQWAGNWWDAWDGATGQRIWSSPSAWIMTLDAGGNLQTTGYMHSNSGRVMSISGGNPSVSCWDTGEGIACGMWVDQGQFRFGGFDGGGNPTQEWARFLTNGQFHVWSGMSVGGPMQCSGSFALDGNQSVGGQWWSNGRVDTYSGRMVCHSWQPTIALEASGVGVAMGISLNVFAGGGLVIGSTDYWGNPNSMTAFSNLNSTFGAGGFYSWSGQDRKSNIRPAGSFDSLAAIVNTETFSYDSMGVHTDHGFVAENVARTLPDVVEDIADLPAINIVALIAHAFRAIKLLNDKIERRT